MKLSIKQHILLDLFSWEPRAVHEFGFHQRSQISVARRLVELRTEGLVFALKREGKTYNEWRLSNAGREKASELEAKRASTPLFIDGHPTLTGA